MRQREEKISSRKMRNEMRKKKFGSLLPHILLVIISCFFLALFCFLVFIFQFISFRSFDVDDDDVAEIIVRRAHNEMKKH